jgi:branched-chain amino acid transport system permease protein
MLVYAIVLILVMLATNNATFKNTLRELVNKIIPEKLIKRKEGTTDGNS